MGRYSGKVALVTGASTGIGRATAILFAREGARVVAADNAQAEGHKTVSKIKDAGGEATFVETDVANAASVQKMVKTCLNAYGRIDVLFNNAGVLQRPVKVFEMTEDEWDLMLDVNLKSVFLCSKYVISSMLKQGGGSIINNASVDGLFGMSPISGYSASKAGVVSLTKTMSRDHSKENIRINCVCPGAILTPMTESFIQKADEATRKELAHMMTMGRWGQPEEVGKVVLMLASEECSYVTGAVLTVDGGETATRELPPMPE